MLQIIETMRKINYLQQFLLVKEILWYNIIIVIIMETLFIHD